MKRIAVIVCIAVLLLSAIPAAGESVSSANGFPSDEALLSAYTPEELLQQWLQIGDLLRANGTYPFVELEQGNTGYEVIALQTRLAELGYYHKEIVDYFGNGTFNAMRDFEKANGLPVNGAASVADQQALFGAAAVAGTGQSAAASTGSSNSNSSPTAPDATSGATSGKP